MLIAGAEPERDVRMFELLAHAHRARCCGVDILARDRFGA